MGKYFDYGRYLRSDARNLFVTCLNIFLHIYCTNLKIIGSVQINTRYI